MEDVENQQNLDELWKHVCILFPILCHENQDQNRQDCPSDELSIMQSIVGQGQEAIVEQLVLNEIETQLRREIVPTFWKHFSDDEIKIHGLEGFKGAVDSLYDSLSTIVPFLQTLELLRQTAQSERQVYGQLSLMETFKVMVRASLHSQLPLDYQAITEDFYRVAFKVFCNSENKEIDQNESAEDIVQCAGCCHEIEFCQCQTIIEAFHDINGKLQELDLLERLAGDVLTTMIHRRIENHVQETCKGSFDVSHIGSLEVWLDTVVMGWLSRIYSSGSFGFRESENKETHSTVETLSKMKQTLRHFLYETYTRTRIDQLFNIIIEYPDSEPAVEDLRICLLKTDLRQHLTQKLQRALETRLLHPGVNTPDILTAYVAAIRALRTLDPSGVLLDTVTQPVRQYLRWRDDTVRCVVTSLTEEGPSELAEELSRGEALQLDDLTPSEEDTKNWETWNPDPVDADPSKTSQSRRTSDIISMLVNVYGSKDLFVNEYRTLLADRLLSSLNYNTDKEIRYLELLKLRFGESQLHYCEVMLKDIYDSKRINTHLHSDTNFNLDNQEFAITAMILSAQFWPHFNKETLELPEFVQEHLNTYTKAFETLKGNRTLSWKPQLGSVNLDIELKDRKINLTVSPIHATIIWHFQSKNQWTIEELSQIMHAPATLVRRKITYWQSQGLLHEIGPDSFELVEESGPRVKGHIPSEIVCDDEETESAMASAQEQREEELQVFWSYIVGMLTNLDSMPLERILQMLKMFALQGPTTIEVGLQELRHFLDRKVAEEKLLFYGGVYRLPKS